MATNGDATKSLAVTNRRQGAELRIPRLLYDLVILGTVVGLAYTAFLRQTEPPYTVPKTPNRAPDNGIQYE